MYLDNKDWLADQLRTSKNCTAAMAQTLLYVYQLMHKEQFNVHIVHIIDWEDYACMIALGDAPAQWTVYCVQFFIVRKAGNSSAFVLHQ